MRADHHDTKQPSCETPLSLRDASPDAANTGTATPGNDGDVRLDDVIDVRAAAQLLRVGRNTIYALVGRDEIPHRRLGKQIRFSRAALVRWCGSWSSQGAKEGQ